MDLPVIDYTTPGARTRRLNDRDWMQRGICSTSHPEERELFYSPTYVGGPKQREPVAAQRRREEAALKVCGRCPVRERCLVYALDAESQRGASRSGVWGGTTAADRDAIWTEMGYQSRSVEAA